MRTHNYRGRVRHGTNMPILIHNDERDKKKKRKIIAKLVRKITKENRKIYKGKDITINKAARTK